ncbi:hypothetical protein LOK49_LG11G02695 [Camellia lanceoleosa]|uniref:Uncharacterized protein n=1 Tax=Camellia lanceoleosa TaxID=1840588 RepID=A0ACC0G3N8_9ERIC|nr:hypothetical protein LOK49_LG11G02695 [Camellia lanceoleosa]
MSVCFILVLYVKIIFPENHLLQKIVYSFLAQKYEELYQQNGAKFLKIVIGIGAKPAVSPFERLPLNTTVGGIQVDGQFRTSVPGIFAIGDMYDRIARVEHVDHARQSAQHCVKALLSSQTDTYDYLPHFYSRVFEYEGSPRKVWWQFFGDNVGDTVEIGNFDPKIATFWIDSGKLKGVLLESGSPEEFQLLPKLARSQPFVDKAKLESASSVETALQIARSSLQVDATV